MPNRTPIASNSPLTKMGHPNALLSGASIELNTIAQPIYKALRILRMKQLIERTQLSRATLYVLMATDPTFPRKIKLTTRTVGWIESEVDAWISSRAVA